MLEDSETSSERSSRLRLLKAVACNDLNAVSRLIRDEGISVNFSEAGVSPLLLLLEGGADCDFQNDQMISAMHLAAEKGDVECMRLLLAAGASVDIRNKHKATPLHLSTYHRHYECSSLLIDLGAEVDLKDEDGKTALHRASEANFFEGVELLLENGAKLTRDSSGKNPADYGSQECRQLFAAFYKDTPKQNEDATTNTTGNRLFDEKDFSKAVELINEEMSNYFKMEAFSVDNPNISENAPSGDSDSESDQTKPSGQNSKFDVDSFLRSASEEEGGLLVKEYSTLFKDIELDKEAAASLKVPLLLRLGVSPQHADLIVKAARKLKE